MVHTYSVTVMLIKAFLHDTDGNIAEYQLYVQEGKRKSCIACSKTLDGEKKREVV